MAPEMKTPSPNEPWGPEDRGRQERVPGLLFVFDGNRPVVKALPLQREPLAIGRDLPELGLTHSSLMSRWHAQAHFDGQRFWVADLNSKNGTFIDWGSGRLQPEALREFYGVVRLGDALFVPCTDLSAYLQSGVEMRGEFVRGPAMQALLAEVEHLAEHGDSLHLHGESGTGKEGVAKAFHNGGPGPFVAVNCATIPPELAEALLFGARRGAYSGAVKDTEGFFVAAEGGTLFLDEVVELSPAVQTKLLRVLESREVIAVGATRPRPVRFRLCSASHRDLRDQVARKRMREDLYFRLGGSELTLPPLRKRPEEIAFLLAYGVRKVAPQLGLDVSLVETCLQRPWPGNVRELLNGARVAAQKALFEGASRVMAHHLGPQAGTLFRVAADEPAPFEPGILSPPRGSRVAPRVPAPPPAPTPPPAPAPPPAPVAFAPTPPATVAPPVPAPPTKARPVPPPLPRVGAEREAERGAPTSTPDGPPTPAQPPPAPTEEVLKTTPRKGTTRAKPLDSDEKARIEAALRDQGGNVTAAAKALGRHRTHLRRLIDRGQIMNPRPDPNEPPFTDDDEPDSQGEQD